MWQCNTINLVYPMLQFMKDSLLYGQYSVHMADVFVMKREYPNFTLTME